MIIIIKRSKKIIVKLNICNHQNEGQNLKFFIFICK